MPPYSHYVNGHGESRHHGDTFSYFTPANPTPAVEPAVDTWLPSVASATDAGAPTGLHRDQWQTKHRIVRWDAEGVTLSTPEIWGPQTFFVGDDYQAVAAAILAAGDARRAAR
ncbi:MAG TPA: hypothetical protein VIP28_15395 [Nocardioides sp.]